MNNMLNTDEKYMRRCLQLARNGLQNAMPNPMVGAVIVYEGRIIGEGYHVRCGEGHAEVNACASVKPEHEHLLKDSTIYVSLEPCSHYGKTPPCAELLVRKGFKRCVIGCIDPFAAVKGRGVKRLQDAGIEVTVGVLEEECKELNKRFITFHKEKRPFVTLKWAQSADGYIDGNISNEYTKMLCHKFRAEHQAIMVGHRTYCVDNPSLDTRYWYGFSPRKYIVANSGVDNLREGFNVVKGTSVNEILYQLYLDGIQSVLVEGGAQLHKSFIDSGLWDECYCEQGCQHIDGSVKAPILHNAKLVSTSEWMGSKIYYYSRCNL